MKIYQPMLYIGLGGTGCMIGAELERRMREELCGPDGTDLQARMTGMDFLPYQLPSCTQFVYADLNEAELNRLEQRVTPAGGHVQAVARTQHVVQGLVPRFDTYPEVARSLRTNLAGLTRQWLPPPAGEPRVAPLARGAGQLPTVGRAALLETFRAGTGPAQQPILDAIGQISTSGGELQRLGGRMRQSCDVFVAFSVAGGTGGGIFYDYLHLIGDALARSSYRAQIYPLVVMPSAFAEGMGGGRYARLNAGRALLDLFRLVDDQNGQAAQTHIDDVGLQGALSVRYPSGVEIRLRPSTVQTAFLFSLTAGMEREDLHRSVVSLMLSLIGTDQERQDEQARVTDRQYQSFADEFINRGIERELPAPSGLGSCGVSTSLVASMTVPVDDLADIVSSRLLAEAVSELSAPPPGTAEMNRDLIKQAFGLSNVEWLQTRSPLDFTEPTVPAKGADAVIRALSTRLKTLDASLDALDRRLAEQVPRQVQDFDPRRAADQLLGQVDLFRLQRVLLGHRELRDPVDQLGYLRLLESRRREPEAPAGQTVSPPQIGPGIRDRLLRRKTRWTDEPVQAAIRRQDEWFRWRAKRCWHAAWADQTPRWERKVSELRRSLIAVTDAFIAYGQNATGQFVKRAQDLYRPRTGVSYLLPPQGNDLEPFYQAVLRRFRDHYVRQERLRPTATVADVVNEVLGEHAWQAAWAASDEGGPARAVSEIRDRLKQAVLRLFRYREPGELPLLPALTDLLAAAAGRDEGGVGGEDLQQFRQKVAALVPGGFDPQGSGALKVLISYPAVGRNADLERYLLQEIHLPRMADSVLEFRPIEAESIVVVLFRTSMSVTEVPELRGVLKFWADAMRDERPQDYLKWRQRLGYDFGYLISTEEHRVHILHRLLCAMWNGWVQVLEGPSESPSRIIVRPGSGDSASMVLPLTEYDATSSWASLLRAYEEWTITDDESIRRDVCARLMASRPDNVDRTPRQPAELYWVLRKIADDQLSVTAALFASLPPNSRSYAAALHDFWARLLPAALDLPFRGVGSPVRATLRELEGAVSR
jgi:Tubulin like